jgi:hypothetical protein
MRSQCDEDQLYALTMPSPKSGTAGTPVPPSAPPEAIEADVADPGAITNLKAEQRKNQTGKFGALPVNPHKPPQTEEEKAQRRDWIEIVLVDDKGRPSAGEPYLLALPNGTTVESGTLDEKGFARVEGIEPGTCKITFPNLDKKTWSRK